MQEQAVVTGAFGYSGQYITRRLLASGVAVRTITNAPATRNPFGAQVEIHRYNFSDPDTLLESLRGARVLYNTYWVRYNTQHSTIQQAVENSRVLFAAARNAGVERIVHISILNPDSESLFQYYRAKAELETMLIESGLSYAILRPAIIFGGQDILLNNIAWALRHLPVFGVFGNGRYRLQPIYVDDLAELAVKQGLDQKDIIIDAIGPETFVFGELIHTIARHIKVRRLIIPVPAYAGYLFTSLLGRLLGDIMMTREEISALMQGLLYSNSSPAGTTRLTDWVLDHADTLGTKYASEQARRK